MATFPSYAWIERDGYTETPDFGVLRTEMDGGLAKQRARWTKRIVRRKCSVLVGADTNKTQFDGWFKTDLYGGAGWFTYVDPVDGISKQARFVGGELAWQLRGATWAAQTEIETIG